MCMCGHIYRLDFTNTPLRENLSKKSIRGTTTHNRSAIFTLKATSSFASQTPFVSEVCVK